MLDLNRLIGLVYCSESSVTFRQIKDTLLALAPDLDDDDMVMVLGECYQGAGPVTAAIANSKNLKDGDEFVGLSKLTVKSVGEVDLNCPKLIFIISDQFGKGMQHTLRTLDRRCQLFDYEPKFHVIQMKPNTTYHSSEAPRTIVDNADDLLKELILVLEAADGD